MVAITSHESAYCTVEADCDLPTVNEFYTTHWISRAGLSTIHIALDITFARRTKIRNFPLYDSY